MKLAVLMLAYNTTEAQLKLTQLAYESILAQDCGPMTVVLIDNGSDPSVGTWKWMCSLQNLPDVKLITRLMVRNTATTVVANNQMGELFGQGYDCVLGVANDAILPRNLYSQMLRWPRGFVAAHCDGPMPPDLPQDRQATAVHEDAHMAVMMTRRWAYDALVAKDGYLMDPKIFHYCSDVDLKLRMAACGIHGVQLDLQVYHYGSAGWRLATPEVGRAINEQADRDRGYFYQKWGFGIGSPEHEAAVRDINFRG